MTRKLLSREIHSINQRLNSRQEQFHQTNERAKVALMKINPYLIIGSGLLAGVMTNAIGWRKITTSAASFYPFLIRLPSHLMSMNND